MKNKYKIDGNILRVYDCNDKEMLFDAEDFDVVKNHRWYIGKGYSASNSPTINGKRYTIKAHRLVMNAPKDKQVDHINGNKTDNRKSNLRFVSNQENQHNQTKAKGYYFYKRLNKWSANILADGKKIYLGLYKTEAEARAAYLEAKKIYHPTAPIKEY